MNLLTAAQQNRQKNRMGRFQREMIITCLQKKTENDKVRLAAHCIGAGAVIAASVASPNPMTIGSAIHLVYEIYESC